MEAAEPGAHEGWDSVRREFEDVIAAIRLHGQELLAIPNVLFVRPGFRFRNGKLTSEPAVVVSVASKKDLASIETYYSVPQKLGSVVVDVIPASPKEQFLSQQLASGLGFSESRISFALPGEVGEIEASAFFSPIRPYVPPDV